MSAFFELVDYFLSYSPVPPITTIFMTFLLLVIGRKGPGPAILAIFVRFIGFFVVDEAVGELKAPRTLSD